MAFRLTHRVNGNKSLVKCCRPARSLLTMARMGHVLGVDGGASNTVCTVLSLSDGQVMARSEKGSCNRNSVGASQAISNLFDALQGALLGARTDWSTVKALCLGISGVDSASDVIEYTYLIRRRLEAEQAPKAVRVYVCNDAVTALASGTKGSPNGIALIAGTGSIAYGSFSGRQARAGGWGATFKDGGCGYDLGQQALASAAKGLDGRGPATQLTTDLPKHLMVDDMNGVSRWVYQDTAWSHVASLAPAVIACAGRGDKVATVILEEGASDLKDIVRAVFGQLQPGTPEQKMPLVLSGGLLLTNNLYADIVKERLLTELPWATICVPEVDAATGAALLGAHYISEDIPEEHPHVLRGTWGNLSWEQDSVPVDLIAATGGVSASIALPVFSGRERHVSENNPQRFKEMESRIIAP